ncbi:restriction endonuclease subunit S [Algibacter sp. R77976]|uniref:restriction endonuclease subunit S n=1 Tax=Algibacter sp. R77976 TaxID=3093873 RepID=UPI0037C7DFBA
MNNWKELHIGNEVNILSGYPFDSKRFNTNKEGKPLIRIRDILESSISTYFSGSYSDTFLIKKGDILVGMDGDFHVAKWNNIDALLNQRILKLHQKKDAKIDIDYFYYFLQPFLKKVHDVTAATTVKHLSTFDIIRAKKRFPEVRHQKKIAKILSTIDAVIEKTENTITKYQAIKKGMMHDLFTRGIDVKTGQLRPSFDDAPALYKDSEIGLIPKDWDIESIKNSTYLKGRIGWQGLRADEFIEEGPFLVTGTDFIDGEIKWGNCYHVSEERFAEAQYIQLKNDDFLITKDGTIGKLAFVSNCPDKAVLNSGIFLMRCKNSSYINRFLFHMLSSSQFDKYLYKTLGGSTIIHLYQREFEKFLFPLPNKTEQKLIIEKIDSLIGSIKKEKQSLKKYENIKKGLMQDLLTGKVEVKV